MLDRDSIVSGHPDGPTWQGDALPATPGQWLSTASGRGSTLRAIAATALALHGLIHLIGFIVPWRIATMEGMAYRTTILGGALEIGDPGSRLLGVAWLGLALAFLLAAWSIWRGRHWGLALAGALAMISLIACVLGLPETVAGLVVNVVILAGVLAYSAVTRRPPLPGRR